MPKDKEKQKSKFEHPLDIRRRIPTPDDMISYNEQKSEIDERIEQAASVIKHLINTDEDYRTAIQKYDQGMRCHYIEPMGYNEDHLLFVYADKTLVFHENIGLNGDPKKAFKKIAKEMKISVRALCYLCAFDIARYWIEKNTYSISDH